VSSLVPAADPRSVHVVVPGDVDDDTVPSGGNAYDRRVCAGLPASGWRVTEVAVTGAWPRPGTAARRSLARVLADVPDGGVVLVDGLVACGVPEVVVPQADRLALVVLVHLPLGDELGAAPGLAALEGETLRAAAAVVTTSPWAARRVVAVHGVTGGRVHVAPPGVDPAPPATGTDGASRLLCVGAVTATKGQDRLVEALAAVADLPWTCDLVGSLRRDPAYAATVARAVERHGLGDRLRMAGPRTPARLAADYAAADLVVLPSRRESYGMVLTEALARGVPVLATAVGGVPETVGRDREGRVPGLLVAPDDAAALASAVRRWWSEPDLRVGLRRVARVRRPGLEGWEETIRCLSSVLDRLRGTPG
jgi:glycosyltransferase involved in cell wall biosynthesis